MQAVSRIVTAANANVICIRRPARAHVGDPPFGNTVAVIAYSTVTLFARLRG